MLLIIVGGIGFLTWDDIYTNKLNIKRYRMQSKIILMTTAGLILIPTVFFFVCDLKNLSAGKRLLAAAFPIGNDKDSWIQHDKYFKDE